MKKLLLTSFCITVLFVSCDVFLSSNEEQKEAETEQTTNKWDDMQKRNQEEAEREEIKYLGNKIISQKTNRTYSDGLYTTPIYRDDNGRDYILVKETSENGVFSGKIVYLDNGQERDVPRSVFITFGL